MNPGCQKDSKADDEDILLILRVQPRASRNEWAGRIGDAIKVRLTAPPVDGKANAALLKWLAREFGVSQSAVSIEAGGTSRNKRVCIHKPQKIPTFFSGA